MIHPSARIHPTAVIGPDVVIEAGVEIGPYCVIGQPPEYVKFWGKPHKGVLICKGAVLTGMVTIDAGLNWPTLIHDNCFLMKHSHVGHDATLHKEVTLSPGAKIAGHCIIGQKTNIGLNAVVHQHVEIPERCMIGMGAVITKSLEMQKKSVYVGNPAKFLRLNEPQ